MSRSSALRGGGDNRQCARAFQPQFLPEFGKYRFPFMRNNLAVNIRSGYSEKAYARPRPSSACITVHNTQRESHMTAIYVPWHESCYLKVGPHGLLMSET